MARDIMALLSLARWTQPNYARLASNRGRAQLLTIPYSHFVSATVFQPALLAAACYSRVGRGWV